MDTFTRDEKNRQIVDVEPLADGRYNVGIWLLVAPTTGRRYETILDQTSLYVLLHKLRVDPDAVYRDYFGYSGFDPLLRQREMHNYSSRTPTRTSSGLAKKSTSDLLEGL